MEHLKDYQKVLNLFLKTKIETELNLLIDYLNDVEDSHIFLQDFISYNLKDKFNNFTAISIMDGVDKIIF